MGKRYCELSEEQKARRRAHARIAVRIWRAKHPGRPRPNPEKDRAWRLANRDRLRSYDRKYRAKKAAGRELARQVRPAVNPTDLI